MSSLRYMGKSTFWAGLMSSGSVATTSESHTLLGEVHHALKQTTGPKDQTLTSPQVELTMTETGVRDTVFRHAASADS